MQEQEVVSKGVLKGAVECVLASHVSCVHTCRYNHSQSRDSGRLGPQSMV